MIAHAKGCELIAHKQEMMPDESQRRCGFYAGVFEQCGICFDCGNNSGGSFIGLADRKLT